MPLFKGFSSIKTISISFYDVAVGIIFKEFNAASFKISTIPSFFTIYIPRVSSEIPSLSRYVKTGFWFSK